MIIQLGFEELETKEIKVQEYIILHLLFHKRIDLLQKHFTSTEVKTIIQVLILKDYVLSDKTTSIKETILSNDKVRRLLGIKGDVINFWEFYNCYPIKIGNRVLRASSPTSQIAKKHEKKYLKKVKTKNQHEIAIKAVTAFIASQKSSKDGLKFLPIMETVMNNSMWQQWEVFIEQVGKEGQEWNNDTI